MDEQSCWLCLIPLPFLSMNKVPGALAVTVTVNKSMKSKPAHSAWQTRGRESQNPHCYSSSQPKPGPAAAGFL